MINNAGESLVKATEISLKIELKTLARNSNTFLQFKYYGNLFKLPFRFDDENKKMNEKVSISEIV